MTSPATTAARCRSALATALLVSLAGCATTPSPAPGAYAFGVWGDLPYSAEHVARGVPHLIADMNASRLAFSVHVGDLKAGSGSPCDDAFYQQSRRFFDALEAPAVFTPGDNDWTDCDRPANGGFEARGRLDRERAVFFGTPWSMGARPMRQQVQDEPPCLGAAGPVPCAENRRWWHGPVVYATLNIAGSCNNLCDQSPDADEHAARDRANIQWLRATFEEARARDAVAVVLISQANPGWDANDPRRAPLRDARTLRQADGQPDGFHRFLAELRPQVVAFGKPVLYLHGDSHYFRIDRPFLDGAGRRLQNFTRLEPFGNGAAFGNNDAHWVKVVVDPRDREVFSFQPMTVPANRTPPSGHQP